MTNRGDYFYCKQSSGPLSYWVVQGKDGELRSSFPVREMADLHRAQLNAAFTIGQREMLKEQMGDKP